MEKRRESPYPIAIDGAVYINLDHCADRKPGAEECLRRVFDGPIERISAVRDMPGFLGCTKSHIKALRHCLEKGWEWFIVAEDDCILRHPEKFIDDFVEDLLHVKEHKADMYLLTCNPGEKDHTDEMEALDGSDHLFWIGHAYDTGCTLFSRQAAEAFLVAAQRGVRLYESQRHARGVMDYEDSRLIGAIDCLRGDLLASRRVRALSRGLGKTLLRQKDGFSVVQMRHRVLKH